MRTPLQQYDIIIRSHANQLLMALGDCVYFRRDNEEEIRTKLSALYCEMGRVYCVEHDIQASHFEY